MNSPNSIKAVNLLTMCRKAGRMVMGFDPVKDALELGKAFCVLTATDISPKTLKEVNYVCERNDVTHFDIETDMDTLHNALGKRVGVIAICDAGFAKKFKKMFETNNTNS
ncbi:MAG: ribosomal L7Ae/L30e/S12e/Gadd45 family protein [Oscillospiraceae bacterium]